MLASLKVIAGDSFKTNQPFLYEDVDKTIGCLVLDNSITFLFNKP
jgi:hypothetical protein